MMAHEGYPGHHVEHATKEQCLYEQNGWTEACVQLINAPDTTTLKGKRDRALLALFWRAD